MFSVISFIPVRGYNVTVRRSSQQFSRSFYSLVIPETISAVVVKLKSPFQVAAVHVWHFWVFFYSMMDDMVGVQCRNPIQSRNGSPISPRSSNGVSADAKGILDFYYIVKFGQRFSDKIEINIERKISTCDQTCDEEQTAHRYHLSLPCIPRRHARGPPAQTDILQQLEILIE